MNGTIAATGFTGSGAGLSNLDGGQIVSGSVTSAQLAPGTASANLADSGQSGVPSGGMILSDNPANAALAGAGYIKLGKVELISEKWNTNYASGPLDAGNLTQARSGHSAVWTGTEMIIWGGFNGTYLNDGYRYNPAANTWTAISRTNAPAARGGHCAVWTGSKMIVWGGADRTGGLYNPATDTWSAMSAVNAPPGYTSNAFAWTGTYLLVWGGIGDSYGEFDYLNQWSCADYGNGGRYNPSTDTWTAMSTNNAPGSRAQMAFAWTGAELVVWGGLYEYVVPGGFFSSGVVDEYYNTGARYNPSTDSWTPMTTNGAPSLRCGATAVWTGSQFLVWGGVTLVYTNDWFWGGSNYFPFNANTGGRYSPSGNSWSAMSSAGAPTPRSQHTALWTGSRMTVWGGSDDNGAAKTGGRYDPTANTWLSTTTGALAARYTHTAIWTGTQMIVWGGEDQSLYPALPWLDGGGRYNITNDTWTAAAATPSSGDPGARQKATAVWTGSEMIIWGGESAGFYLHSGGRFNPALNTWTAPSLVCPPSGRINHTALWSGSAMLIWGGYDQAPTATGASYDPASDSWMPLSKTNAPSARSRHTAVWTGSDMVVWGGIGSGLIPAYATTGGRYNPATDSWRATSTNTPPAGRSDHTAVWTGSEMIVWGGESISARYPGTIIYYSSGARYNPSNDSWIALPTLSAPQGRAFHSAVWTGSEMLVWGGLNGGALNTGGRYNPSSGWSGIDLSNAPTARYNHAGLWDGAQMIVWGGTADGTNGIVSGARFLPRTGEWTPTSGLDWNLLKARVYNTAVWTGTEMLIWGGKNYGYNASSYLNDVFGYTPRRVTYLYLRP